MWFRFIMMLFTGMSLLGVGANYDVIIVGAGLSGATAAYKLQKLRPNASILILEASNRAGGRVFAKQMNCSDGKSRLFDMGGTWINKGQIEIENLLKELNIPMFKQYSGRTILDMESNDLDAQVIKLMAAAVPNIHSIDFKMYAEQSLAEWTREASNSTEFEEVMDLVANSEWEVNLEDISALYALIYFKKMNGNWMRSDSRRVVGTSFGVIESLIGKIGEDLLYFNTPVTAVDHSKPDVVQINTEGECFYSKSVIFAIPPAQLSKVQFSPPLPLDKQYLLQQFKPRSNGMKTVITFKTPFWRTNGIARIESGYLDVKFIFLNRLRITFSSPDCVAIKCRGILTRIFGVDYGSDEGFPAFAVFVRYKELTGLDFAKRRNKVISTLACYLGNQTFNEVIDYAEKNWVLEPYIDGCVATVPPGNLYDNFTSNLQNNLGRLFFAGTETANNFMGFMNGAVESAERAVNQLIRLV